MLINFANETALIIGLMAVIGLVLQRKKISFVIEGTIKAVLGYIILQFGASLAILQLSQITVLLEQAFNINGIMPNNEMIAGISQWFYGKQIASIMFAGMFIHLIIARLTPFKYIFLTGHHILYMASMIAGIMANLSISFYLQIIIGSVILALAMSSFPAFSQPMMRKIVPDHSVAIGHFGSVGFVLSGYLAKIFGKKTEFKKDVNLRNVGSLAFLNNPAVIIALFMLSFFLFIVVIIGKQSFIQYSGAGEKNIFLFAITKSLHFTAGVYIIFVGVRMLLTEVVSAFKGIADKIVPHAIPALDCPVIFPYAPTAVIVGFTFSLAGGFAGLAILIMLNAKIILPAVITHFFAGGSAGVFGYVMGGMRGAVIGSFAHGLLITFLALASMPVMHQIGYTNTTYSGSDFSFVGMLIYLLQQFAQFTS